MALAPVPYAFANWQEVLYTASHNQLPHTILTRWLVQVAAALRTAYDGVAGEVANSKSVNMAKIWHLLQVSERQRRWILFL